MLNGFGFDDPSHRFRCPLSGGNGDLVASAGGGYCMVGARHGAESPVMSEEATEVPHDLDHRRCCLKRCWSGLLTPAPVTCATLPRWWPDHPAFIARPGGGPAVRRGPPPLPSGQSWSVAATRPR